MRYQPRVVRSPAAHAPGVRSGRSCHTQPTRPWESPVRPAVGFGRSSHTRLQQPASRSASGRVLSPPYAAVRPNARLTGGAWSACVTPGQRRTPYARSVRSAAVTRSSAPVQSISQRGRQRLTAAATQQPPHAAGNRLPAAPPAANTQQRPPEAVPGRDSPSCNPIRPAQPVSACGLLAAHLMLHATPDAAAPEGRFPRPEDAVPAVTIAPAGVHRKRASPMAPCPPP